MTSKCMESTSWRQKVGHDVKMYGKYIMTSKSMSWRQKIVEVSKMSQFLHKFLSYRRLCDFHTFVDLCWHLTCTCDMFLQCRYHTQLSTYHIFSSAVPPGSGAFQMPTRPSSAASTLRGGKGKSPKLFSKFFSFLAWSFFRMPLITYHKEGFGWIALRVIFKGQNLCPFSTLDNFLKNWSVTFSLFWHEPSQGWY